MGGVQHPHLNDIAKKIWEWCEIRKIYIFASYIRSKENSEADLESPRLFPETEYELSSYAFSRIIKAYGQPKVDLFVSRANKKCELFVSWKKDPESMAIDAFTTS